jgi:hypothetical protein
MKPRGAAHDEDRVRPRLGRDDGVGLRGEAGIAGQFDDRGLRREFAGQLDRTVGGSAVADHELPVVDAGQAGLERRQLFTDEVFGVARKDADSQVHRGSILTMVLNRQ